MRPRLCPLLPRETVLQRTGPRAVHVDQQKSADESEVLVEVPLIGRSRRTFHGPEIVHQYARERDEHDQDDRCPARLIADENQNSAEQIMGRVQINGGFCLKRQAGRSFEQQVGRNNRTETSRDVCRPLSNTNSRHLIAFSEA